MGSASPSLDGLAKFRHLRVQKSRKDSSDYSIIQRPDCLFRRNEQSVLELRSPTSNSTIGCRFCAREIESEDGIRSMISVSAAFASENSKADR